MRGSLVTLDDRRDTLGAAVLFVVASVILCGIVMALSALLVG